VTARTLPIRLAPVRGEALDSYLEALACCSGASWGDIVDAVGLAALTTESRSGSYPWMWRLSNAQSTNLSRATGVDPSTLEQMTLSGFLPAAFGAPLVPLLLSPPRSRFCPRCLAVDGAGRWQLWWRLRWAFACPRHRCLLADCCPACARPQRVRPLPSWLVPQTGACARPACGAVGRDLTRCGALLSAHLTELLPPRVLTAQGRLLQSLQQDMVSDGIYCQHPVTVPQFLADLTALVNRILSYAESTDLASRLPVHFLDLYRERHANDVDTTSVSDSAACAGSVRTAVGVVCALDVLGAADVDAAGHRLRWLVGCSRGRGAAVTASNIGWGKHVSTVLHGAQLGALEPFLGPSDQLRYRCGTALPRRPQPAPGRGRHVPGLLWASAIHGFSVNGIGAEQLRSALSVAVLVAGTPTTLSRGAELLGSVTTAASVSRVLQALHADQRWGALRATVLAMADAIDHGECPIDYDARRMLPFTDFLPPARWHEICAETATPAGTGLKIRVIRSWMYQRIVGSPARCAPAAFSGADFRNKLTKFVCALTPELVGRLDGCARGFLDDHGHCGEPVYWDVPETLRRGEGISSAGRVDIDELHRLIRDPALTLTDVAARIVATVDDLLELLGSHPAPLDLADKDQRRSRGGAFAEAKAQLSCATLTELYVRQGLGLAEIGARSGTSRQTVRRLADHYGIAVRRPGRAGRRLS
jgi:TniQ